MATAQSVLSAFRRTFPDCSRARALEILNEVDEEVLTVIPLRKESIGINVLSGKPRLNLPESVVRIFQVEWVFANGSRQTLVETSESDLDLNNESWRGTAPSQSTHFGVSSSRVGGTAFLWPPPATTSLVIASVASGATTQVTFSTAHGLSNGAPVCLVGGPDGADGASFAQVLNATTIALFQDSGLSRPVTSTGTTGTSPAIAVPGKPVLALDASVHVELTESSPMPALPQLRRLYANGMRAVWAMERHSAQTEFWRSQFERDIQAQHELTLRRATGVQMKIELVRQDAGFRSRGAGVSR